MSTPARLPEIIVPDIPQRIYDPPDPNSYEKGLIEFGLSYKAQRSAIARNSWEFYKAGTVEDSWRRPLFTVMLRTDGWKAQNLAEEQENTYHSFGELIGSTFTILSFKFMAKNFRVKSVGHQHNQGIVRAIRKVIDEFLPVSIDKVGACEDKFGRYNRVVKVIHASPVDGELHKAIQSALPEGVTLQHHVFNKADFHTQFLTLLAPDLPRKDFDRAGFEAFLDRMVQIQVHKISSADRKRFAYTPTYVYANQPGSKDPAPLSDGLSAPIFCEEHKVVHDKNGRRIPRSPKTGAFATHVSVVVDMNTKAGDILPEEWLELPPPR